MEGEERKENFYMMNLENSGVLLVMKHKRVRGNWKNPEKFLFRMGFEPVIFVVGNAYIIIW